jgi:hypothetical protein
MTSPWPPPDPASDGLPPIAPPVVPPIVQPPVGPPAGPRFGEMAPPGYVSPVPAQPPASDPVAPVYYAAPPIVRKPRTADVVVTCILLTVGLFVMLTSLTLPPQLDIVTTQVAAKYGVRDFDTSHLGAIGLGITISQIVIYLIALGVSIPLMLKRRVSFWVPLSAGALAGIIFWALFIAALFSDPRVMAAVQAHRG